MVERRRFYQCCAWRASAWPIYMPDPGGRIAIIIDVRSATARTLEPRWIPGALHVPLPKWHTA